MRIKEQEKFSSLGMFSLRRKRLRGDMIDVFKMIHSIDKVNIWSFFVYVKMEEQENSFCLKIRRI